MKIVFNVDIYEFSWWIVSIIMRKKYLFFFSIKLIQINNNNNNKKKRFNKLWETSVEQIFLFIYYTSSESKITRIISSEIFCEIFFLRKCMTFFFPWFPIDWLSLYSGRSNVIEAFFGRFRCRCMPSSLASISKVNMKTPSFPRAPNQLWH